MVPGKKYSPEDFLLIAWRRRWVIVLPFVVIAAGTFVYARSLPSLYKAETLIQIVPPQIPRTLVPATGMAGTGQRLDAIRQQVLSRSRIEQLIQEFDPYPEMRGTALMEDIVQRVLLDVSVELKRASFRDQTVTSFSVGYVSPSPTTAQRVTERIASMFIEASLKDREMLADGTDQFIEAELVAARNRLEEQEKAIADYRRQYPWDQAEQAEHNRWLMVNTQQALDKRVYTLSQSRDRLIFIEKMVADLLAASPIPAPTVSADANAPQSAAAQLEAARTTLRGLELRLKPEHPDILRAKRVVAELARKAEQEALSAPVSGEALSEALPPQERDRLANLRNEIDILKRRIAEDERDEEKLRKDLVVQIQMVENYPLRAREMQALTRDYDTIKTAYLDLLRKKEAVKIQANVERRQQGEQLRVIEPAMTPQRPFSPDRVRFNLLGAAAGLIFGLGLAALIEYRDTSLRTDDDVLAALSLPVLALVPVMRTAIEVRRSRRRRLTLSLTGAVTLVMTVAAAVFWTLRH